MDRLIITSGNILDYLKGDYTVVNSANKYMRLGSGVSGAIYKAAGVKKLEDYCKNNFSSLMKTNEIRLTPGFNASKNIIHIYAPKKHEHENYMEVLKESYKSILNFALENNLKNIASVSLGTGVHGYKHEEVKKHIVKPLYKVLGEDKFKDITFTLVLPNADIKKLYKDEIK